MSATYTTHTAQQMLSVGIALQYMGRAELAKDLRALAWDMLRDPSAIVIMGDLNGLNLFKPAEDGKKNVVVGMRAEIAQAIREQAAKMLEGKEARVPGRGYGPWKGAGSASRF